MGRVWLITGASRGFGRAFAEEAAARGDMVIAAARRISDDEYYNRPNVLGVAMDVTNPAQIKEAVQQGVARFGRIDVLVNNAGFGFFGAFEETSDEELRNLFETCFFGVVNVMREVVPIMRAQGSGRIINISSRSGAIGEAGCTAYNAVKFAVAGMSEGLNEELSDFGIQVMTVFPGGFRTDFRDGSSKKEPKNIMPEYEGKLGHRALMGTRAGNHKQPGDPRKAARLIWELACSTQMPGKLMLGQDCCDDMRRKYLKDLDEIDDIYARSVDTKLDAQ